VVKEKGNPLDQQARQTFKEIGSSNDKPGFFRRIFVN